MTDAIQAMGQNKYPLERWYDSLFSESHTDTRTAEEIAIDIITRAGLKFQNPEEGDSE